MLGSGAIIVVGTESGTFVQLTTTYSGSSGKPMISIGGNVVTAVNGTITGDLHDAGTVTVLGITNGLQVEIYGVNVVKMGVQVFNPV